jgi:integrase
MKDQQSKFKSPLAEHIEAFLSHKRALGSGFVIEEKSLRLLDRYLVEERVTAMEEITPKLLDAFLASRPRFSSRSYNHLLSCLRRLFAWLALHELCPQSPLRIQPKRTTTQRKPFLFDKAQARRLLEAAARLPDRSNCPLRGETYRMIFALLYGLGLRVGEVSRLCRKDLDLDRQLVIVHQTKFSKSRLVPFGPRMYGRLCEYLRKREDHFGTLQPEHAMFSFARDRRKPISPNTISWTFHKLVATLNLSIPAGVAPPHLHCLRHSFAVGTLLRWYQAGIDPSQRLFYLSTFLGHVSPSSTAVYLTITTELLQEGCKRFEQFVAPILSEVTR